MTQAITPKATTNTLLIEGVIMLSNSGAANLIVALFQDATANALAAWESYQGTATGVLMVPFMYSMTAGTTSSTTFKIRAGSPSGTTYFNGVAAGSRFSTAAKSMITITEYKV